MQIDQKNEERRSQEAFQTYYSRRVKVGTGQNRVQKTTEPQPKMTRSYKKKCIGEIKHQCSLQRNIQSTLFFYKDNFNTNSRPEQRASDLIF